MQKTTTATYALKRRCETQPKTLAIMQSLRRPATRCRCQSTLPYNYN